MYKEDAQKTCKPDLEPVTQPIAIYILEFASLLAKMAEELANKTHEKLKPIMLSLNVCSPDCEKAKQSKEYPPLFSELRDRLWSIESSLHAIENAISRTEL